MYNFLDFKRIEGVGGEGGYSKGGGEEPFSKTQGKGKKWFGFAIFILLKHQSILKYDYILFKSNLNIICNYLDKLPKYIYNTDGLINDLLTANNEVNCQTKQCLIFAALQKG